MVSLRWLWMGALGSLVVGATACGDDSGGDSGVGASASGTVGATSNGMQTDSPATMGNDSDNATSAPTTTDPTNATTDPTNATTDPTSATDGPADSSGESGDPGGGTIDVTLSGCSIDFGGTVVVSYNGSLGVASVYDGGASLSGSFQFELDGAGTMMLSSQHRVDTGNVINMVETSAGTWTNLDSDALSGGVDTIGGTLVVNTWDPAAGISDIEFQDVSLRNVSDGNVCTVNGTIVTTEIYP